MNTPPQLTQAVKFPLRDNCLPAIEWKVDPSTYPEIKDGQNYAVYCGHSGLIVLDLDNHGTDGVELFQSMCPDGEFPKTFTVSTPSNGYHLYFRGKLSSDSNGIGRRPNMWPGVDVLGGSGYVVGPGSYRKGAIGKTDGEYQVVTDAEIAVLPDWLRNLIFSKLDGKKEHSTGTGSAAYERFTAALQEHGSRSDGRNWQCPAHPDRNPSMAVTDAGDRVLVHCFAGCDTEEICSVLGLDESEMFDRIELGPRMEIVVPEDKEVVPDEENGWEPWNPDFWHEHGSPKIDKICSVDGDFGLFYAGKTNTVIAESESGKSWLGLRACADEINKGNDVAFIDFEDSGEEIYTRLLYMADWDVVRKHFFYFRPETPIPASFIGKHVQGKTLVVIDGYGEALTLHGLKQDDEGVLTFNRKVSRPMSLTGVSVVHLDHFPKAKDNQNNAFGSVYKKNTVSGASYFLRNKEAFGKDLKGYSVLEVAKDRPGQIRTECENENGIFYAAELHIDSTGARPIVKVKPVTVSNFVHKIDYCQRVSDYMWETKTATKTNIRENVKGKNNDIAAAIDQLVKQGCLVVEDKKLVFVKHYKEPF